MRRLKVGDRVVRVRDEGEGRTPIVCLHGAGASSVVWMDVVRRLAPGRRVIAPDLPGHGQSDPWQPPEAVSIESYRDAVGTVCATLEVKRAVLVGHSLGGLVALECAAAFPERVAGVVMVTSGARLPVSPRVFEVLEKDPAGFPEWLNRLGWSPATPRERVEKWAGLMVTAEPEIIRADFRAVERYDGREAARAVRAPMLILAGGDDLLAAPALSGELAALVPSATEVRLPRAGHFLHLEQPDEFHAALDRFLVTAS